MYKAEENIANFITTTRRQGHTRSRVSSWLLRRPTSETPTDRIGQVLTNIIGLYGPTHPAAAAKATDEYTRYYLTDSTPSTALDLYSQGLPHLLIEPLGRFTEVTMQYRPVGAIAPYVRSRLAVRREASVSFAVDRQQGFPIITHRLQPYALTLPPNQLIQLAESVEALSEQFCSRDNPPHGQLQPLA